MRKLLITSFRPWLAHHHSNASDDLLALVEGVRIPNVELIFLRKLIVDTRIASEVVIKAIATHQPNAIICCGMAESRQHLTLEIQAFDQDKRCQTQLNLARLCQNLERTKMSYDAGKFVCEGLYFHVLQYLEQNYHHKQALFVHVPCLTEENQAIIVQDFRAILQYLGQDLENYLYSTKE